MLKFYHTYRRGSNGVFNGSRLYAPLFLILRSMVVKLIVMGFL